MKKKTIALCGLAAVAGLSLASCGGTDTSGLDIYINYSGTSGITYRGAEAYTNEIEGKTYTQGVLLPTWQAFSDNLGITFRDASDYTTSKDDDTHSLVQSKGYVSDTNANQKIDLFYNTTSNINKMGAAGEAVDLVEHLDDMPNLKAFLDANPTIRKTMEKSGKIYYTPYFDGYNDVERMLIMDTAMAEKVIDTAEANLVDTNLKNGGTSPAANLVQKGTYTPYMDATNNYPASEVKDGKVTVTVLNSESKAGTIQVNVTTNIIVQQNELLNRPEGATGKELAVQFQNYLNTVYGNNVGEGQLYSKLSEVFTSASAAYNTDELIALMRVVKANPKLITGDENTEIETLFPRGQANNRVDNIMDFAQIWGIQGLTSEKDMLFFAADGTLRDAATDEENNAYYGVTKLSEIYDEGLILGEFWNKKTSTSGTAYLDKYFKKTAKDSGYGFMMYDYSAANCAANDIVDGVGTNPDSRTIKYETKGIMPILPPLAYWNNGVDATTGSLTKTLMRYAEENRSLKSNSWCIPSTTDNLEEALKLMDYMFSEDGARIQDFGPSQYWEKELSTTLVVGEETPILNETTRKMLAASGKDFWSFMRENLGATHGIGCERSKGLDIQATNAYGQIGLSNLKNAIAAGVVDLALVDKVKGTNTWDTTVPTAGYPSISTTDQSKYAGLTAYWASDKCSDTPLGWVYEVANYGKVTNTTILGTDANKNNYTKADIETQKGEKNKTYLYQYAKSISDASIPSYAKTN